MTLLHILQFWTHPELWFKPRFWFYNEKTPAGFRILTICGIAFIFDRPDRFI